MRGRTVIESAFLAVYPSAIHGGYMKNVLIVTAVALSLSACTSMSVKEIRDAGQKDSFIVKKNYQAAYRPLSEETRRCFQIGLITASWVVHGDLYTDIKRGTITVEMVGGMGTKGLLVVDVSEVDSNSSRIDIMEPPGQQSITPRIKKFFDGVPIC